jgi:2-aminoadipate transaminase
MTTLHIEQQLGPNGSEVRLADWTAGIKRSVLREMLAVVSRPGILSFAGGLPAPELFPVAEYGAAVQHVLATDPRALQYGPPFEPLREHIVELMAMRGVVCRPEQVFITTGAQQALNVIGQLLLNAGDAVILEEFVYSGIHQAVAAQRPNILTVPTDLRDGLDVEAVAGYLRRGLRPAFLYAITEAHNPLGVSISAERQAYLLELAEHYGLPILEDDPYGFLRYDDLAVPPIRARNDEWVFYVGSFSKILAPALRLGWMIVPERLAMQLTVIKEAIDLETSAFIQRTVSAYLDAGHLPRHLAKLRTEYGRRRDAMLAALAAHFPAGSRWTRPTGGMFIWVELPGAADTTVLLQRALAEERVAFIPGTAFTNELDPHATEGLRAGRNCLRLNFSKSTPEDIADGIARLGYLLERAL